MPRKTTQEEFIALGFAQRGVEHELYKPKTYKVD